MKRNTVISGHSNNSFRTTGLVFCAGCLAASIVWSFYLFGRKWSLLTEDGNGKTTRRMPRVVLFGDSITQKGYDNEMDGWVGALSNWLIRHADVVNRGFSGYCSRWGVSMLDNAVLSLSPGLVIVFFGANDAVDASVQQHVPLGEYRENLVKMVKVLKRRRVDVMLITPPPVWEPDLERQNIEKGKPLARDRTNERTRMYALACISAANELKVPVVDTWTGLEGTSDARASYLVDGLHLNTRGNRRLFQLVQEALKNEFPHRDPQISPQFYPPWADMASAH